MDACARLADLIDELTAPGAKPRALLDGNDERAAGIRPGVRDNLAARPSPAV